MLKKKSADDKKNTQNYLAFTFIMSKFSKVSPILDKCRCLKIFDFHLFNIREVFLQSFIVK